jgi:hypothetical protein
MLRTFVDIFSKYLAITLYRQQQQVDATKLMLLSQQGSPTPCNLEGAC